VIALISDIHANLEALCAVMDDIQHHPVEAIVCLGDIVGYGPDPEKCTDIVMQKAARVIMGNHDFALLNAPFGFNPLAAEVIRKTQKIMRPEKRELRAEAGEQGIPENFQCKVGGGVVPCMVLSHSKPARWNFFKSLGEKIREDDILYVHGSPLDPTFEYVFPDSFESGWDPARLEELFFASSRICFCGHTHIPCAIDSDLRCIYPPDCDFHLSLDGAAKYIVNLGSVGQPRDRDNRASYILFDRENNTVTWRRIIYDIDAVIKKSDALCGPGNWCGERLRSGR
jgi:predicted phosphodiesterase